MKEFFADWQWIDTWGAVGVLTALLLVGLVYQATTADHSPRFYYIEYSNSRDAAQPCVKAWQEWTSNATVFCSDDVHKVIDVMNAMNAGLPKSSAAK